MDIDNIDIDNIDIKEKTITKEYITYDGIEISVPAMIDLLETVVGSSCMSPIPYSGHKLDMAAKMAETDILARTAAGSYYEKDKNAINNLLAVCYTRSFEKEITTDEIIENIR